MATEGLDIAALTLTDRGGAVRFAVQARPRAPRSRVLGVRSGALWVALAAAPTDGAANTELARELARIFGVATREVTLVAGRSGKRKIVEIRGIDARGARERLERLYSSPQKYT